MTDHCSHSEDEYRTILKTTSDGFWIVDLRGRFLDVNDAACRMLGYERAELLAVSLPDVEAVESPEDTSAHIEKVLATGFDRFESCHRCKDGTILDVEVTTNYLPAGEGRLIVFVRDITVQKKAGLALLESEARFRGIFENTSAGIALADVSGNVVSFNAAFQQLLGYPADRLRGMNFVEFSHPDDMSRELPLLEDVRRGGRNHYQLEKRLRTADSSVKWIDGTVSAVRNSSGDVINFVGIVSDITARREAEARINLYANVFQHSGEGIVITDAASNIVAVNRAFTRLTGYSPEEVVGNNPRLLASGQTPPGTYQAMWASLQKDGYWQGEMWDRRRDGHLYPKWLSITAVRDDDGVLTNYVGSFTDISERKAAEEQISHLAHHDALTGLYNRFSLQDRLEQTLLAARREHRQIAVMFIDMDHFKAINDTLGHQVGDTMLIEVARRIQAVVRESDIVARLGGDEFVVVLAALDAPGAAMTVVDKIMDALGAPYVLGGQELHSTPSIGIGMYPADGENAAVLMRNADTAMYHAKTQGRNNFQFFTAAMNAAATRRLKLEHDLRRALGENQLLLYYQPKVDARSGRICGLEALVRWQHPEEGLVPPNAFIAVAEECGLIVPLGEWVIHEACRQLAEWKTRGISGLRVAVNISAQQLRSANLLEQVRAALADNHLHPSDLELEITESVAMADPEHAVGLLQRLSDFGVALAIDDFGTGYSSLAYLKRLPIEVLKLDRSFVMDIETDEDDAAICAATITLAHTLGIKVVAEGVETEGQRAFLADRHRCDILQGYLYSQPLSAPAIERWLHAKNIGDSDGPPRDSTTVELLLRD